MCEWWIATVSGPRPYGRGLRGLRGWCSTGDRAFPADDPEGPHDSSPLADDHPLASAAGTHRTFILVLGTGDINAPGKGLDGLIDFVKHRLAPTDRVGVTAYLRTSEPSTDHAAVLRFLERYKQDYQSIYDRIGWDGRPPYVVTGSLSDDTRRRVEAVFSAPGVPTFSELPGLKGSRAASYTTHNYIRWTIQNARRIAGEKHVVVVAAGRLPGVGGRVYKENPGAHIYVKLANEARVALSYINTGGSRSSPVRPPREGWAAGDRDSCRRLDTPSSSPPPNTGRSPSAPAALPASIVMRPMRWIESSAVPLPIPARLLPDRNACTRRPPDGDRLR